MVPLVYLQGAPVFDVEEWVRREVARFSRSRLNQVAGRSMPRERSIAKAADAERERVLSAGGPFKLYVLRAVDVMQGTAEQLVRVANFPSKWRPRTTMAQIMGGLHLSDTVLTPKQKEAFHLRSLIGVPADLAAEVMHVSVKAANSHLSSAWKEILSWQANPQVMKWFIEAGTDGHFAPRKVESIEDEIRKETEDAIAANEAVKEAAIGGTLT
jgi:hypothetical protein